MATELENLSHQRLDFSTGPAGELVATLSVSLKDGSTRRYTESVTEDDLEELAIALAHAGPVEGSSGAEISVTEAAKMSKARLREFIASGGRVRGKNFGDALKGVGNVAKKVVTSKVFKKAGAALAVAAPALGPFAPAAMAVSTGMGIASKLGTAAVAAEAGAKNAARLLTESAVKQAARLAPSNPKAMLTYANDRRKRAHALAATTKPRKPETRKRPAAGKAPSSRRLLEAAKAGRVRSNQGGPVKFSELVRAHKSGRVFFVAA